MVSLLMTGYPQRISFVPQSYRVHGMEGADGRSQGGKDRLDMVKTTQGILYFLESFRHKAYFLTWMWNSWFLHQSEHNSCWSLLVSCPHSNTSPLQSLGKPRALLLLLLPVSRTPFHGRPAWPHLRYPSASRRWPFSSGRLSFKWLAYQGDF